MIQHFRFYDSLLQLLSIDKPKLKILQTLKTNILIPICTSKQIKTLDYS